MIAKVIARGATRAQALDRLAAALADTIVIGPRVNTPFLAALVDHPDFRAGRFDTGFIDAPSRRPAARPIRPRRRRPPPTASLFCSNASASVAGVAPVAEPASWRDAVVGR